MFRDFAIALSLANLHFFAVWADLLPGAPAHYFMERPPPRVAYSAAASNVVLGATILWVAARFVRRLNHPAASALAQLAFLAVVAMAVNSIRLRIPTMAADWTAALGGSGYLFGKAAPYAALGALAVSLVWRRTVARLATVVVLIMAPFSLLTLGHAYWTWVRHDVAFTDFGTQQLAQPIVSASAPRTRVLWLVFDELDQRLAFESRPPGVDLPEFDRFSRQSISATNAYPPANNTLRSMPALITGRSVAEASPARPNDLWVHFEGSRSGVLWSGQDNVFSRARVAGVNSGLVGSYHPYCRVIGRALTTCSWQQWRRSAGSAASGTMLNQNLQLLETVPGAKRIGLIQPLRTLLATMYGPIRRDLAIQAYEDSLAELKRIVNRPDLGLILAHLPVPHPPYIYRRSTREFVRSGDSSYFDNLVLADVTLCEIRRTMEDAATWDATSILITADHGYRTKVWRNKIPRDGEEARTVDGVADARVPFILKVAGQTVAATYQTRLNTVAAHDLVLALLHAEITDVAGALQWMASHGDRETNLTTEPS